MDRDVLLYPPNDGEDRPFMSFRPHFLMEWWMFPRAAV